MPADAHFVDRPRSRELFDAVLRFLEREGPVTISVSTTRIEFMTRVRFAGAQARRDYLRLAFWLKRRGWRLAKHRRPGSPRLSAGGPHGGA